MYKKYLIVASKLDRAGINITTQMSYFGKFNFLLIEKETIFTENLDLEKINQYDFVIFASKHESAKKEKTLSVHAPGNFRNADFGGVKGKVCKSSGVFQKELLENLEKFSKEHNLNDYNITLEATHHGPLINKPCVYIEIGSTDTEWKDTKAAFVVAKTIAETIKNFKENKYREVAIGIGGPHYCPNFNKIQLKSNVALSHIIAQYNLPLTEEIIKEAIEKTQEEVDFVILDWKGIPNSEERKRIIEILNKNYIQYKRTNEILKEDNSE